jgi:CheY-like chemotaxis protein
MTMSGVELIEQERLRQISEKGYDAKNEDSNDSGSPAIAAAAVMLIYCDHCAPDDPIRILTIAAALLAAEIDRLQRRSMASWVRYPNFGSGTAMAAKNKTHRELLVSIVDDDASVRKSTRRLLRCAGLRAEAFASAEEFLQSGSLAATDCLILDVRMPGMDGLELQRRLSESACWFPIVFFSARASEEEERRALRSGASFLRKPVSKEALLHAIHAALEKPAN